MKKIKLNDLQKKQLRDCIAAGCTIQVQKTAKSQNKGWSDTPLFFNNNQQKLWQ